LATVKDLLVGVAEGMKDVLTALLPERSRRTADSSGGPSTSGGQSDTGEEARERHD
jgi:hypothetical protein